MKSEKNTVHNVLSIMLERSTDNTHWEDEVFPLGVG